MIAKFFVLVLVVAAVAQANDVTEQQKLVKDLFKDYVPEVDPGATNLTFRLSYVCADLNRLTLGLTSKLLESYEWVDTRLKWDPSAHGGIKQFRYPASKIWKPDMKLYNAQEESEIRDEVNALVYANGTVIWIPTVMYKTYCVPIHDRREESVSCLIQLGSWTYDAETIVLKTTEPGLDTFMYLETCSYVIAEPAVHVESKSYPCCPEQYSSLFAKFIVHHRAI